MSNRPSHDPHRDSSGSKPPDEWLENLLRSELNDRASGERPSSNIADLAIKRGFRIRRQRRLAVAGAAASILVLAGVSSTYAIDALTDAEPDGTVADFDEAVQPDDYGIGFVVDDGDQFLAHPADSDQTVPLSSSNVDDVVQVDDMFYVFSYGEEDDDPTTEMVDIGGDSFTSSINTLDFEFSLDDVVIAEHAELAAVSDLVPDHPYNRTELIGTTDAVSSLPDSFQDENGQPRSSTLLPLDLRLIGWDENSVVLQTDSELRIDLDDEGFIAGGELFDSESLRDLRAFGTEQIMVNLDPHDEAATCVVDLAEGERFGGPNVDRDACLAEFHSHIDTSDPRFKDGFEYTQVTMANDRQLRQRDWATQSVHNGVSGKLYSHRSEWTVFVPHEGDNWYLQPAGDNEWVPLTVPGGAVAPIDVR